MISEFEDYRQFLKGVLQARTSARKSYSLRAFASSIGISNSHLPGVLSNKKVLSMDQAFKIAMKLELSDLEMQYFCLMVQKDHEQDPELLREIDSRLALLRPKDEEQLLSTDLFRAISEWYHIPILELTFLTQFKLTAASISKKLDITKLEAETALKRLQRLGLLELKNGNYQKTKDRMLFNSSVPNEAFRDYHSQLLRKAEDSLKRQLPNKRVSTSDVIAIDSKYLPQITKLSKAYSESIFRIADKSKIKNSVYALSLHFFNLTPNYRENA